MRCPSCQADNKEGETRCGSCQAELVPGRSSRPAGRGKSRRKDPQGPLSPETEARNRAVLRAYRLSILGLLPGLGLVLGPVAMILGGAARSRCLRDPDFTLWGPLTASILFGAVDTLFNWIGFAMMYLGLRSAGML